jgi:hypothetical protein
MRKYFSLTVVCLLLSLIMGGCATTTSTHSGSRQSNAPAVVTPVGKVVTNVECNRECLASFMTTYLKALVAHDASKLPVTRNVKYTENGVRLNLMDGLQRSV